VKLVSFGGGFFILLGERGVVAKEGLCMVGLWLIVSEEPISLGYLEAMLVAADR
jgi:hypothetical protein